MTKKTDVFAGRDLSVVHAEVMVITPEIAEVMLTRNEGNRPVSDAKVAKYAAMIASDSFPYNGASLSIGRSGRLLNGQHRLLAVRLAKKPIQQVVVWGVRDEVFATIDSVAGRTGADVAALLGWENASVAAAVASIVTAYDSERLTWGGWHALTVVEIEPALSRHPGIADSIAKAYPPRSVRIFRQAWFPAASYILTRIHAQQADSFITKTLEGTGLHKGDPIYSLREALLKMNDDPRKPLKAEPLGMTIRAWNAMRRKAVKYKVTRPKMNEQQILDPFPRAV